jgi:hypothetical protein
MRLPSLLAVAAVALAAPAAVACRDAPRTEPPEPPASVVKSAAQLSLRLRGANHFLVGLGNDLDPGGRDHDGAFTLGTTLDLHYAYLRGLPGRGGWSDSPAGGDGAFVDTFARSADAHGTTPMFTLYAMADEDEDNMHVLSDPGYMGAFWTGARMLFQRLGAYGKPSVVHLEPDFWGFAQRASPDGTHPVLVKRFASECRDATDDLRGMARCLLELARTYAPAAAVGFHASAWAGTPASIVRFFRAIGADGADLVVTDVADRDAGCWERGTDPQCQGPKLTGLYLDETNRTSPNFHEELAWAKEIHDGLGLPVLWWQVPLGVPRDRAGGRTDHYRDNHVHYMFDHVDELIDAGGVGAVFGAKVPHQTTIATDGGQFKAAVARYFQSPAPLRSLP